MEPLDAVIVSCTPGAEAAQPWRRFDFDGDGRLVSGFMVVRRVRARMVNSRSSADCETVFRAPDTAVAGLTITLRYRVSCPLHGEEDVARALYHPDLSPKEILDRYVAQAAQEYIDRVGQHPFLEQFTTEHHAALKSSLELRIPVLSRLKVERMALSYREADPTIAVVLSDHPIDMANYCFGVPLSISLNLAIDPDRRGLALAWAGREEDIRAKAEEWIKAFFRRVPAERLLDDIAAVQEEMWTELSPQAADYGRSVQRLALAPPRKVVPVDDQFEQCWLKDETNVTVSVKGALWILTGRSDIPPENQNAGGNDRSWLELKTAVRAHLEEVLKRYRYLDIESAGDRIADEILAVIRADAYSGVGLSIRFRFRWDHEWLLKGVQISKPVECAIGPGRTPGSIDVSGECVINWEANAPWQGMSEESLKAHLHKLIDSAVRTHVETTELAEYVAFTQLKERIIDTLRSEIRVKLGLGIGRIQVVRTDDHVRRILQILLKEAPRFDIAHPRAPELEFETQYRVIDTAVESGTPFPVYPTDIREVTSAVEGCIRDVLSEIPVSDALGIENQNRLKKYIETMVPKRVQERYYLKIAILLWLQKPVRGATRLAKRMQALLDNLATKGVADMYSADWVDELRKIAPLVERQGGDVPWLELAAYDVERGRLLPPGSPGDQVKNQDDDEDEDDTLKSA